MTIINSVPASTRRPGVFSEFNIANAARGLVALTQRIALVGAQGSGATATALDVTQAFSEAECDSLWGQGSELALMAKYALRGSRDFGVPVQVWGVGIADAGGTAATYTFTVTGTATAAGEVVIGIAGRVIRAAVASGDLQNDIAQEISDAISEQLPELPVAVSVLTNVVTITAINTGVNGNDILAEVTQEVAGVTVVAAAGAAGAGTIDITAALDNLEAQDYDFVAISNHTATDISDFTAHLDSTFLPGTKRWRFGMMAETGSLATGQALATAADDYRQLVISAEGFRNTPGEIAAYLAGYMGGTTGANTNIPWNNRELPTLALPDSADVPTNAELESGINGGLFMLSVNEQQSRAKIVRAVTTQVTLNSAPFFALLDMVIPRTMFFASRQVDIALTQQFANTKKNDRVLRRIKAVILGQLRLLQDEFELLQNVQERAGELTVETDPTNPDRVNTAIPTSVVPPLNQIVNVFNLIVE